MHETGCIRGRETNEWPAPVSKLTSLAVFGASPVRQARIRDPDTPLKLTSAVYALSTNN